MNRLPTGGPDAAVIFASLVEDYSLARDAYTPEQWDAAVQAGLARLLQSECRIGPAAGCLGCLDIACHEAHRALTGQYPD